MAFFDHNRALLAGISPAFQSRYRVVSWGCSFCFHAVALAVAAVLLRELPKTPIPVYRMEILLSDPQAETDSMTPQETTALAEDSSPVVPAPSPSIRSDSDEVGQPALSEPSIVQRTAQQSTNAFSPASDSVPVERPMPIKRQTETVASVSELPPETLMRSEMTAASEAPASPPAEPLAKRLHDQAEQSAHVPPDLSQDRSETTADASPSSPIAPSANPAPVSDSSTASLDSSASSPTDTVAMSHPTISRAAPVKSQYGWLAELLRRRTMSLLAYPRLARMQGWEGVVVVKTTIDSDGGLVEAVVTKSSGYDLLDEDALKLMHRVCPIRLPQDLGRSHISMSIPIRYRIEQ